MRGETIGYRRGTGKLGIAWSERDEGLCSINKREFYAAAQAEYGDAEYWDADTWHQVIDDLTKLAEWVKALSRPFLEGGTHDKKE